MSILTSRPTKHFVPLLQNGDRLTRDEFERRYEAMPELKHAELIEGVVYMGSPVRAGHHGSPHARLVGCLLVYEGGTPGVCVYANTTVRLDRTNEPQPDGAALIDQTRGGQACIDAADYITGSPELVAEVAASTVSIDRNTKYQAYERNGVREYILWRVEDGEIDWFILRSGRYELLSIHNGVYQSEILPGFWLDAEALLQGNIARVLAVVQQGLASPEHAAFVARLAQPTP